MVAYTQLFPLEKNETTELRTRNFPKYHNLMKSRPLSSSPFLRAHYPKAYNFFADFWVCYLTKRLVLRKDLYVQSLPFKQ